MSTKNTQTSALTFDPTSMATYQGFQPTLSSNLRDFANNPLQSSFFNTQLQMSQAQNRYAFQTRNNAFLQNLQAGGAVGNLPAYAQSQLQQNARGLSADNSNSFNNLLLGANQLRFGATNQMAGYRPLQTGGTNTQRQSGIGSWLPQVAGTALGLAGMVGTGGAGSALGSAFFGGASATPFAGLSSIPGGYDTPTDASGMGSSMPSWLNATSPSATGTWQ